MFLSCHCLPECPLGPGVSSLYILLPSLSDSLKLADRGHNLWFTSILHLRADSFFNRMSQKLRPECLPN